MTYGVIDTLSSRAGHERIAQVTGFAEADGPIVARTVLTRFTLGIAAARVRVAQVVCKAINDYFASLTGGERRLTLVEGTAPVERVAGVALGARADGLVVLDAALGPGAARPVARVHALEVEARLVRPALLVLRALRVAARERVAEEVGRARADGAVVLSSFAPVGLRHEEKGEKGNRSASLAQRGGASFAFRAVIGEGATYSDVAIRVGAARAARILAAEADARSVAGALAVRLALATTALQMSKEARYCRLHLQVIFLFV